MSATALKKHDAQPSYPAAVRFFEQLSNLFAVTPGKISPLIRPDALEASINALKQGSNDELVAVRAVLDQMSSQIDRVLNVPGDEQAAAVKEDDIVRHAVAQARAHPPERAPDHGSAAFMDDMRRGSAAALQHRIANRELLPSSEFQAALNITRQSLSEAVRVGRMFALVGPSGENFYPAFFADASLDRRSVEKAAKALGTLPAASKYFFFTSKSMLLNAQTPLDALKKGQVAEVMQAAASFAAQ
jgi:hypothetical protein